jgi:Leucine-rich repeat (LRR) protein
MKKFKNIKLMLIGLFAFVSMTAWAAPTFDRYEADNGMLYGIKNDYKYVWFVGVLADNSEWEWDGTITIPATVTLKNDAGTGTKSYTVASMLYGAKKWFTGDTYASSFTTQDIEAKKIKSLNLGYRIDANAADDDAIGWGWTFVTGIDRTAYTSLETLVVSNAHNVDEITFATTGAFQALKTLDFSGVVNDGLEIEIPADFVNGSSELTTVTLPTNDPLIIREGAFLDCEKLATLNLGDTKVTKIEQFAFNNTAITALTIPATVEEIGKRAFGTDVKLETVNINSNKLTAILGTEGTDGEWFNLCSAIKNININSTSITKILAGAFAPATGLQNLKIEGDVLTTVEDGAFASGLTSLVSVDLVGTKLKSVAAICDPKLSYASLTTFKFPATLVGPLPSFEGCTKLATITAIPTGITDLPASAFKNCVLLTAIDLSATGVKSIPASAFQMTADLGPSKKINGVPQYNTKLETVTLNTETTAIAEDAFAGCSKLTTLNLAALTKLETIGESAFEGAGLSTIDLSNASAKFVAVSDYTFANMPALTTVKLAPSTKTIGEGAFAFYGYDKNHKTLGGLATIDGLNSAALESIDDDAFFGAAITALDLSGATNGKFKTIPFGAFQYNSNLATVTLPAQIEEIEDWAFADDIALSSINLNQTNITVLNKIFTTYSSAPDPEISLDKLTSLELVKDPAVTVNDKPLDDLLVIEDYALQFTGLQKVVIPSTVYYMGDGAFRACVNLTEFEWKNVDPLVTTLPDDCFRGDVKLAKVTFLALAATTDLDPIKDEEVFFMCDKDLLKVILTPDHFNVTEANGYGNDNRTYSTLDVEGNVQFAFSAKGLANDGFYYATYYNEVNSSWFDATKFEVFSAVVDANKVVLKPAKADEGYYKVARYNRSKQNEKSAVCVVRSKDIKAVPELKSNDGNEYTSTFSDSQLQVSDGTATGSKLSYIFKLSNVKGNVAFYRVTSGTFAEGKVYIDAEVSPARLDIVVEGEGAITGIKNLFNAEEDNAPIFNLQGVQVKEAKNGMYIKNGKKFIVK